MTDLTDLVAKLEAKVKEQALEIAGLRAAYKTQSASVGQLIDIIEEKDREIAKLKAEGWVAA